jgi:tRNA-dihydrouridine synthase B
MPALLHPGAFAAKCPVFLAPMAGFTDAAMRRTCHQHGAALTFTEMVNATGVLHDSDKTWHLLETLPGEGPVVAHLYGIEPEIMAAAAAAVAATGRFVAVDVNAGCPVRKITTQGCGAALMPKPERVAQIVAAMHAATTLPITVKTRIGLRTDRILVMEVLRAVEEAGGAALTVHARFASQEHSGDVHLKVLAEVKRASRIPIVGNGGIRCGADARRMLAETGVDALMIGRGAMGNPWIFEAVNAALETHHAVTDAAARAAAAAQQATPQRDLGELRQVLAGHVESSMELQRQIHAHHRVTERTLAPEAAVALTFRCHLFRYLAGLKGASYLRGRLNELHSLADILHAVDGCLEREGRYRAGKPARDVETVNSER